MIKEYKLKEKLKIKEEELKKNKPKYFKFKVWLSIFFSIHLLILPLMIILFLFIINDINQNNMKFILYVLSISELIIILFSFDVSVLNINLAKFSNKKLKLDKYVKLLIEYNELKYDYKKIMDYKKLIKKYEINSSSEKQYSEKLKKALEYPLWKNHKHNKLYKMDGKGEWKIVYYPIFEDGKNGQEYDNPKALVESKTFFGGKAGIDYREVPLFYLEPIIEKKMTEDRQILYDMYEYQKNEDYCTSFMKLVLTEAQRKLKETNIKREKIEDWVVRLEKDWIGIFKK